MTKSPWILKEVNGRYTHHNGEESDLSQYKEGDHCSLRSFDWDAVRYNTKKLTGKEYNEFLNCESLGGNAGHGRSAVNCYVDRNNGRIVKYSNYPPENDDIFRVQFLVKHGRPDSRGDCIESVTPHTTARDLVAFSRWVTTLIASVYHANKSWET